MCIYYFHPSFGVQCPPCYWNRASHCLSDSSLSKFNPQLSVLIPIFHSASSDFNSSALWLPGCKSSGEQEMLVIRGRGASPWHGYERQTKNRLFVLIFDLFGSNAPTPTCLYTTICTRLYGPTDPWQARIFKAYLLSLSVSTPLLFTITHQTDILSSAIVLR